MSRTRPLAALVFLSLLVPAAADLRAEDEDGPVLTRFSEARFRAMKDDQLILVVLDPVLAEWELVRPETRIANEVLERAAEEVVVVRLPPTTLDAASRYVRRLYEIYDTVGAAVVIDAEGRLFQRDVPADAEGVLRALADARDARKAYHERLRQIYRDSSLFDPMVRRRVQVHMDQRAFGDVAELLELEARDQGLDLDLLVKQAETLAIMGSNDAATAYTQLIEGHPEDRRRALWRIERALLPVCPVRTALLRLGLEDPGIRRKGRAALLPLLAEVQAEGDVRAEAAVRLRLLPYLANPAERIAQMDWIVTHDPDGPDALPAYVWLVQEARSRHDVAEARLLAASAVAEHGTDEHLVPWLRDRLLPFLDRAAPEEGPLRLEAYASPAAARVDEEVDLTLEVKNVSRRPLESVVCECRLAGPLEPLTRDTITFDLGVGESRMITFVARMTGTETAHALLYVRDASTAGDATPRGTHLRIDPLR